MLHVYEHILRIFFLNGPIYSPTLRPFHVKVGRAAIAIVPVSIEWGFMHFSLIYCS